jgi:hypothetical protein
MHDSIHSRAAENNQLFFRDPLLSSKPWVGGEEKWLRHSTSALHRCHENGSVIIIPRAGPQQPVSSSKQR